MATKLWLAAFAAPLNGGFQHGFHLGIFNMIDNLVIKWYHDIEKKRNPDYAPTDLYMMNPVIMSSLSIGATLGSLLVALLANKAGRKTSILITTGISFLGLLLMSLATTALSDEMLIVGRFFMGISVGLGSGVIPIYLVEIAHDDYRGVGGSMYGVMVSVGFLFSVIMTFEEVLGSESLWAVAVIISLIAIIFQGILFAVCKESPKYLFLTEKNDDEGELVLGWLRSKWDIDDELDSIHEEMHVLEEIGEVTLGRMFTDETIRNPLIICTVMMLGHQFCGINVVISYLFEFLRELSFSTTTAEYSLLSLALVYFFTSMLSAFLVDCIGRKPVLLGSFAGMTAVMFTMMIASFLANANPEVFNAVSYVILVCQFLYVISFAFGAGTVPWFMTPELHNHNARPLATTIVVTCGWFASFIFYISFLPMLHAMGVHVYIFYFVSNLITLIFLGMTMRETMNETSVDIIEEFYD